MTSLQVFKKCHGFIQQRKKNHRKSIISRKICINMCVGAVSKPPIGCIETDQNRSNETYAWVLLWLLLLFAYIHSYICTVRWPSLSYYRSIVLIGFHTYEINARRFHCYSMSISIFWMWKKRHARESLAFSCSTSISPALSLRMDQ